MYTSGVRFCTIRCNLEKANMNNERTTPNLFEKKYNNIFTSRIIYEMENGSKS